MRKFTLFTAPFFALALSLSMSACSDDGGAEASTTNAETSAGDGDGDTNGDGDGASTGDGDGDGACYPQPPECALFVSCIGAVVPSQLETVEENFGPDGTCWCGTEEEAQDCFETCVTQVETALKNNPTETACQEEVCTLDELDPTQPYGPVVNGACSDYTTDQGVMAPQVPVMNPLGLPGSFCSPKCSGLANYCPESNQTSAEGTCYLTLGMDNHCISRCYVDSTLIGGTQCQCGARCQPQGTDGEGNMRGICTFE
jgi:hypothetical protein